MDVAGRFCLTDRLLKSGADRGFGSGEEQPAVRLHLRRVQPGDQEHHRSAVRHPQHPGGRQDGQGPDLGHGRGRNVTEPSSLRITGARWGPSWCTTSPSP